jgi:hypothetical protein
MDLGTFYAIVSGTCFALVGLWWNVVERHPGWHTDTGARRQAGGVYLSFLLPGMMSLVAMIDPTTPAIWRSGFLLCGVLGAWSSVSLMRSQGAYAPGLLGRNQWLVVVLYVLVLALAVTPSSARQLGLEPLQAGGLLLVLLVTAAHALTWEFMLERPPADRSDPPGA